MVALALGGVGCEGEAEGPSSDSVAITAFSFRAADNPVLSADVTATINGNTIAVSVPAGTVVTALVATFASTGASVVASSKAQVSGTTANDFTRPVAYRVTSSDGAARSYVVTVRIAPASAKEITALSFRASANAAAGLGADVTATIQGNQITATVPFGTDIKKLVATFTTTADRVNVGGARQTSGTTSIDFTIAKDYIAVAQDGSTRVYVVTVTVALNTAKAITAYSFRSANNDVLGADVIGTITGTDIAVIVPFNTDVSELVATFSTTGAGVAVGGTAQVSGTTVNDFNEPVKYTVRAADGSTQDFTVTVIIAANSAKELTALSFLTVNNPGLAANVNATVTGTAVAATVPAGTNVSALIATFATTGVRVTVGGIDQVSGITPNNFGGPVDYRVRAADNSSKLFTVTVTVAPPP